MATPARPGPFAIDIRGVTTAVPQDAFFFPRLPSGTLVPSRGFGLDLGGHVYLFNVGPARVGIGANLLRMRGTASPPEPVRTGTTPPPANPIQATPDVRATVTTVAPQISLNFGSAAGWSYLSAGIGTAQITSSRSAFQTGAEETQENGSVSSINVGGGARWFAKTHLAFSFEIRVHMLAAGSGTATAPSTPATKLVTAGVGISIK